MSIVVVLGFFCILIFFFIIKPVFNRVRDKIDPKGISKRRQLQAERKRVAQLKYEQGKALLKLKEQQKIELTAYRSSSMTGLEFEGWCSRRLNALGWVAKTTQASGDQGADVIAQKNGKVVVIQCKLFARPVGNKAVQEIFAAKHHYGAHAAAVVVSSSFTPGAIALAKSTGVFLFHADELDKMEKIML